MNLNDWKRGEKEHSSPSNYLKDLVDLGRMPFILLGAFALRDQLRPTVRSAIKHAKREGSMSIRLVSGDHINTARIVGKKAGILLESDEKNEYAVMHASTFEQKVGMNED